MDSNSNSIIAESVDDNIFQWNVKMKNFANSDSLAKDCQELQALHGYDYIELQLDFSMNLYPFFPPSLKVIRPRLQGSLMFGVTNVDCIKLSFWNPAQDMKTVLEKIKDFIQTWARLDVQSERNDFKRFPEGKTILIFKSTESEIFTPERRMKKKDYSYCKMIYIIFTI